MPKSGLTEGRRGGYCVAGGWFTPVRARPHSWRNVGACRGQAPAMTNLCAIPERRQKPERGHGYRVAQTLAETYPLAP